MREGWTGGTGEVSRLGPAARCKLVPRVQFSSHPEHMNSGGCPGGPAHSAATQLMPAHTGLSRPEIARYLTKIQNSIDFIISLFHGIFKEIIDL